MLGEVDEKMVKDNFSVGCKKHGEIIQRLKTESKAWKETCEIIANEKLLLDINNSLKQIGTGKWIPLSKL